MSKTFAATLGILLLASTAGQASVRNFFAPVVDGSRIDNCLSGKADCGKPAADAFCVKEGFTESILFQRKGESCISFRRIKCIGPAETAELTQN
jgi:hypothetical protein